MEFRIQKQDTASRARVGEIVTDHGSFETPVFMPVGTAGAIKGVAPDEARDAGVEIILANTYHLYLRPGHELIRKLGGLHRFMNWSGPILTDSGGFQVYSLSKLRTISEEGVTFQSHIDGSTHFLSPEKAMEIQDALGSDIAMTLDECAPAESDHDYILKSVKLTEQWAQRCRAGEKDNRQALFGIVQGGTYPDLREMSARGLVEMDFDGFDRFGGGVCAFLVAQFPEDFEDLAARGEHPPAETLVVVQGAHELDLVECNPARRSSGQSAAVD